MDNSTKFHIIVIHGAMDGSVSRHGPYPTVEDRNRAAKEIILEMSNTSRAFGLDVKEDGGIEMEEFGDDFYDFDEDADGSRG